MSIGTPAHRGNRRRRRPLSHPTPLHRAAGAVVESLEGRWLLSAGNIDTTFGPATTGLFASTDDTASSVARYADGRFLVAGNQSSTGDVLVARYLANGALDATFGAGGKAVINLGGNDSVGAVAIDGSSIYLAGSRDSVMAVARLTSAGALDTSFDGDGVTIAAGVDGSAAALAIASEGVYAGGTEFNSGLNRNVFALAKFDKTTGAPDAAFGGGAAVTTALGANDSQLSSLLLDASGIVAGGSATSAGFTSFGLAKYSTIDGATLWTRTTDIQSASDYTSNADAHILSLANHGGALLAIGASTDGPALAQYNLATGAPDGLFNPGAPLHYSTSTFIDASSGLIPGAGGLDAAGNLVVGGIANPHSFAAVRYTLPPTGPLRDLAYGTGGTASFDPADGANQRALNAAAVASDGSIVLIGDATAPLQGGNFAGAVVSGAGAVTGSFNTDFTGPTTEVGAASVVDSSGRVIVAGVQNYLLQDGEVQHIVLTRYTPAGALDTSFGNGGTVVINFGTRAESFQSLALDSAGNILVAGLDQIHNMIVSRFIGSSGEIDTSFNGTGTLTVTGIPFADSESAIRVAADGTKVVVAGTTVGLDGVERFYVMRYLTGGAEDSTFNSGNGILTFNSRELANDIPVQDLCRALLVLADHSIVVGGSSKNPNTGSPDFALITLNECGVASAVAFQAVDADGFLDPAINALALQGDNIIAAGRNGFGNIVLARFDSSTGQFDGTFGDGAVPGIITLDTLGTANGARAVAVDSEGHIAVVGVEDTTDHAVLVARLTAGGTLDASFSGDGIASTNLTSDATVAAGITVDGAGNLLVTAGTLASPFNRDIAAERFDGGIAPVIVNPGVAINGAPASSAEGTAISLTSTITPGSSAIATYAWSVTKNGNPYATGTAANLNFTPDDNATYVVTLTVTDTDGGAGGDTKMIAVTNVAPTPTISGAPNTSPEGTAISVTASSTDPGSADSVTYAWSVTKNGIAYASGTGVSFNFTPNDNATYIATLTATDNNGDSSTDAKTINVNNVAPTPGIHDAPTTSFEGTAIVVSATSTDPGSLDTASYAWSVTKDGNGYASGTGVNFSFTPNDNATYIITLTATDTDHSIGTTTATTIVANVPPTAAIVGAPTSSPSGTPVNLTSTVTDPGSLDTFTYAWSVTRNGVAYGTNSTSANYSFTPADPASYIVTLTVTDNNGGSDTKTATINVTPVTAISATLSGGVLSISGDVAGNTIKLTLNAAGNYRVVVGNQIDQAFTFASVNRVLIQGGAGNDAITVDKAVIIPVEIHGGGGADNITAGGGNEMLFGEDGNDTLTGGSGNDVLIGGAGADNIKGGSGRDIMIGGFGADVIAGNDGDDILIAGATAYDHDPVALNSIRAIWTAGDSYTTRVNALKNNLLNASNLFSDTSIDNLSGNGGQDWYVADATDKLKGIVANEIVTVL